MPGGWERIARTDSKDSGERHDDPLTKGSGATGASRSRDVAQEGGNEDRAPQFVPEKPRRSLDEVILPGAVRQRVELALDLVAHHALLYDTWNLRSIDPYRRGTALNLHGPSGTGKSLCAEALAHRLGRPVINVDYAQIESKYVGDTPKNIVRCFEEASEHGAVLVFDEADSILGSRLSQVSQSADHAVNVSRAVMLRQLDRFDGLVVFTTNFPRNYDAAFVRRILAHVRFELPDPETLHRLWQRLLPEALPVEPGLDLSVLAQESAGLAGGDLVNVITGAAAAAARRGGESGVVTAADLTSEIKNAHRARAEVGRAPDPGIPVDRTVRRPDPREVSPGLRAPAAVGTEDVAPADAAAPPGPAGEAEA
ncbi:ATP-binding protein [Streptomyces sp. GMY02]|uniref:ATP-binding protein n=1 Tax=Streptomyces sp. GMY02 TaxID=1333528 RepID=UPI0020B79A50|nr:ATP-binding protein [Streptomyces sp. GMY02]